MAVNKLLSIIYGGIRYRANTSDLSDMPLQEGDGSRICIPPSDPTPTTKISTFNTAVVEACVPKNTKDRGIVQVFFSIAKVFLRRAIGESDYVEFWVYNSCFTT